MKKEARKPGSRWLWWLAGATTLAIVLAAAAGAWYYLYGPRVWTDGRSVRLPERAARLRQVLWLAPRLAAGQVNSGAHDSQPALSADGQELYFVRGLPAQGADIYVSRRSSTGWDEPSPLAAVNTESDELSPCLSPDGRFLLFSSARPGGQGGQDLWAVAREKGTGYFFVEPGSGGTRIGSGGTLKRSAAELEGVPSPRTPAHPQARTLEGATRRGMDGAREKGTGYFFVEPGSGGTLTSSRGTLKRSAAELEGVLSARTPAHPQARTLEGATRRGMDDEAALGDGWGVPFNLGPSVNGPYDETSPAVTPDGRRLIFASNRPRTGPAGARGDWNLFVLGLLSAPGEDGVDRRGAENAEEEEGVAEKRPPSSAPSAPLRSTTTAPSDPRPAHELPGVNTPHHERACCLSPAGDFLYFASDRPGGVGALDLYRARIEDDGRCEPPEHLGPALNSPADDTDPRVTTGGFGLIFSSDRDRSRGFDLYTAESREVYADRLARTPPRLAWSVWALVAAAAVLVPLLLFLKAAGYRHLSLLQKCVVVSLLLHVLMTMSMSLFFIYQPILHHVAEAAGLTTSVNLELAQEVQMRMQIRRQITDLPMTELPVSDPMLADMSRPRPAEIEQAALRLAELNVPQAQVRPAEMTVQPDPPRLLRPEPAEDVSLPRPPVPAETPTIRLRPDEPVSAAEQTPQAAPKAPDVPQRSAEPMPAPTEALEAVELTADRAKLTVQSIAEAAATDRPDTPAVEQVAPAPIPVLQAQPPTVRLTPARPVTETEQALQAAPEVAAATDRQLADTPRTGEHAREVALSAERAKPAAESLARPARAARPLRAAPVAPRPALLLPPVVQDSPEIKLPAPAAAGASAEPVPVATAIRDARELESRPLVGRSAPAEPELTVPAASFAPVQPRAASLIRTEIASLVRPRALQPDADRPAPASTVTPLMPLTTLGRLTSPDAFFQRHFEQRRKFIDAMGGSKETEAGVAKALAWLAGCQQTDGRWTYFTGPKPDRRAKSSGHDVALTSLAALCFLAADHTPGKTGPYAQSVARAIDFIVDRQKPDGDLRAGGDMYGHALATLAVAEAAAMTRQARYRAAAIKAFRFIVNAQNRRTGGWRYAPGDEGDTSVFGWQVMALHSVERGGIPIPAETRALSFRWLDRVTRSPADLRAGYQNDSPTLSMTAEAVLSRIFLGQQLTDGQMRAVCAYLKQPSRGEPPNYYYWYYGSLALFQMQSDAWKPWNEAMRETLLHLQQPDGSWEPGRDKYASRAGVGRVYSTALATLTLEVYYRYLPILGGQSPAGGKP